MEDAHAAVLDLPADDGTEAQASWSRGSHSLGFTTGTEETGLRYLRESTTHQIVAKQEAFKKGDIEQALKDGFLATDRAILNGPPTLLSATVKG